MTDKNNGKKTLYRNKRDGKIAGVCAGIADYFNLETWLVRVAVVSIFLLGGSAVMVVAYVALWMILDEKPQEFESDYREHGIKKKVWQAGEPATQALRDLNQRFAGLETKLRDLETYVTSEQFELKRQINNL
ncbi:envelope stress response membrane protein PspC [Shewanella yunxiaonensis]|uniref:Envelope stress response membrane protein PspC n=1 Tax=Shewanella yunxiaonensis TaxID=2829809 RepID=A0ABX7YR79_9GAMM|nr:MULTISPECIES: envelope stress response membrane protein PspC [Shewanella]MDF0533565.1 envelope stress response membrane protein PspC [Shewanella sp. A32]QUN04686.1 envelope stress response membrane protein PspC [Shewanella yunxiaonensis]